VVLTVSLPGVAGSQGTTNTADPEAELEETRSDLDEVAAELELLRQSDLALEARLQELDTEIAAATSSLAAAEERATAAVAELARVEARVTAARGRVDEQQVLVDERAVSAYVDAGSAGLETMFTSTDANEFAERTLMLERVAEHDQAVLGRLEELKGALEREEHAAEGARADAEASAQAAAAALQGLEQARAEQAAVAEALELRIVASQAEADELAATEDQLVALIAERASQPPEPPPTTTTTPTTAPETPTTTDGGPGPTSPTTSPPSTSPPSTSPPPPPGGPSFSWPAAGPVTSPFGWRWERMHEGIDIGASTGAPISAAAGGTVILASVLGGYGNCVMIDHGSGYVTVYAHQSEILVSEGETVGAGQTIGLVGSTGHSTGPHLHFEIRIGGVPYDPESFLP
jgi:murein DD-endopeptidase MepM/ murein hydrolase activator NlpD